MRESFCRMTHILCDNDVGVSLQLKIQLSIQEKKKKFPSAIVQ